jgi:hypothetical protein
MKFWSIADLLLRGGTVGVLQNLCFTNLRNNLSPEARLVVFRPEWSSWGSDLSFSGLSWQGITDLCPGTMDSLMQITDIAG